MTDENLNDRTTAERAVNDSTIDRQNSGASAAAVDAERSPATVTDTDHGPGDGGELGSPAPQYGVGPFSVREVALVGVWLLAFIVSFFPVRLLVGPTASLVGGLNVWVSGVAWVLAIGLPTIAVFLLVLRRLSPQGIPRFGSLGIDQFASVAFSIAAIVWLQTVWDTVAIALETGYWVRSWVIWVELVLMLAGVVLTVLAPFLPNLKDDFRDRPEATAHRNARPIRPVVPRPKTERSPKQQTPAQYAQPEHGAQPFDHTGSVASPQPVSHERPAAVVAGTAAASSAATSSERADVDRRNDSGAYGTDVFASLSEPEPEPERKPEPQPEPQTATEEWTASEETVRTTQTPVASQQAFWALAPVERDVVDDYGRPLFRIGPTAWALVIEDRGEAFVVRHEDGRVGYLHDVSGVMRG